MGYPFAQPITTTFVCIHCYRCSIPFWVPELFDKERHAKADEFWCPNGHNQVYSKSDAQKLREQLEAEKQRHQATLARENEERAAKEKLERKLKRVHRGVCPHCNRTFQNLARHMCSKHSETPK
jgi:hypothetical protein